MPYFNIDPLDFSDHDWRTLRAAWRKHKQRQTEASQLWNATLKDFKEACAAAELEPHEALHVLTIHLRINGPDTLRSEIAAMRRVHEKVSGG